MEKYINDISHLNLDEDNQIEWDDSMYLSKVTVKIVITILYNPISIIVKAVSFYQLTLCYQNKKLQLEDSQ